MKIIRIKASNFRQHASIDISLDDPKGDFVVIKGSMGAGKTNLLNAITWCVYGDVDDSKSKSSQLLTDSQVLNLSQGSYADTTVQVDLDLGNGEKAFIKRSKTFIKQGETVDAFGDSEVIVQVLRTIAKGYEVEANPENWIERNLPSRFRPYFLFDGEKLERFIKESDAPRIKAAIQEVAKIDTLFRLQEKIGLVSAELAQKAAKLAGADGEQLSNLHAARKNDLSNKDSEIEDLERLIQKAEEQEGELDARLFGLKNIEENIKRKREIDNELEVKKRDLERAKGEFQLLIRAIAPLGLLKPAIEVLGKHVEEARKNKVLPPPVSEDFLSQLIIRGICICGNSIENGNQEHSHLTKLINDYSQVSEVGSALYEQSTNYLVELAKLPGNSAHIDSLNNSIIDKVNLISTLSDEQTDLANALADQDDKEVSELAKQRNEARQMAGTNRHKLATARAELGVIKQQIRELEHEMERLAEKNDQAKKAQHKANFSKEVARLSVELYNSMNGKIRQNVSNSLEEQFKSMTWKKDFFKQISIDEDFKVSVINNRNIEVLDRLSAGERLCLAFAFSLTLSKEAGLNFPIVVDTPMGRLSPQVQVNLATVLAEATLGENGQPNHQIIMLMTETEYNAKVEKALEVRKPKVMEISFDTTTGETSVS
jgi:DNA sulfur modification protein DndD